MNCQTGFWFPDRLMRAKLTPAARSVALALCAAAREKIETLANNHELTRLAGVSTRTLQVALAELQRLGFVWRLQRQDHVARQNLEIVGYHDRWANQEARRPARVIVILWKLPPIPDSLRERAGHSAPSGATGFAPDGKGGGE